ncbi:MAG: helix-turn-helix domain-containing protein [Salinibacterium amurskyense]
MAKKAGVYNGRGRALNDEQAAEVARRAAAGEAKAALAREFGVSRQPIYEYLQPGTV